MQLGEPDASGRRRPVTIPGSEFIVEVDAVVPAIGQESDWACLTDECACKLTDWGTMKVDPLTLQTHDNDIFAGGDAVTGPKTVIEAIAAGKRSAISIGRYLRGEDLSEGREKEWKAVEEVSTEGYDRMPRERMPVLAPEVRTRNFDEVQLGFTEEQVRKEARAALAARVLRVFQCVEACLANAVVHVDTATKRRSTVGAIIAAPGFSLSIPRSTNLRIRAVAKRRHLDGIRALPLSSGPPRATRAPSHHNEPKSRMVQCVGSRDIHHCDISLYGVCCMYSKRKRSSQGTRGRRS